MIVHSIRTEELCSLRVADLDETKKRLYIRHSEANHDGSFVSLTTSILAAIQRRSSPRRASRFVLRDSTQAQVNGVRWALVVAAV